MARSKARKNASLPPCGNFGDTLHSFIAAYGYAAHGQTTPVFRALAPARSESFSDWRRRSRASAAKAAVVFHPTAKGGDARLRWTANLQTPSLPNDPIPAHAG